MQVNNILDVVEVAQAIGAKTRSGETALNRGADLVLPVIRSDQWYAELRGRV